MKKQLLTIAIIFTGITVFGQTKIGANSGIIQSGQLLQLEKNGTNAGLKVAEVALTGSNDVTTIKLPATATAAQGTLIWNTATVAGGNAVSPGFYVWTGALWEKVNTGAGGGKNIYDVDGAITGTRNVSLGSANLNFTTSSVGTSQFTVDGTTFNVDAVNNRVGINTSSPAAALDISSQTTGVSGLRFTNFSSSSTTSSSGAVLGVDASGYVVSLGGFFKIQAKGTFHIGDLYDNPGYLSVVNGYNVTSTSSAREASYQYRITFTNAIQSGSICLLTTRGVSANVIIASVASLDTTALTVQLWEAVSAGQDAWVDFLVI